MSSQQLPPCFYSAVAASLQPSSADCGSSSGIGSSLAAFSSPSFSSSSFPLSSGTESSISASSTSGCGGEEDTECCPSWVETWRTSASGGRSRNGRARRRRGPSAAKKKQKNAQEKERVKKVREEYDALGAVLESRVEKGSGHFNKVRTLAAAIRWASSTQTWTKRSQKETEKCPRKGEGEEGPGGIRRSRRGAREPGRKRIRSFQQGANARGRHSLYQRAARGNAAAADRRADNHPRIGDRWRRAQPPSSATTPAELGWAGSRAC